MSSLVQVLPIGFTGTSAGMTMAQKLRFSKLLKQLNGDVFAHGDCIGSDEDAHDIAYKQKYSICIYPPDNDKARAFCKNFDFRAIPKPYLARNKDIVNQTEILIATPKQNYEVLRSGTWSTIRYAKKQKKPIYIIFPDGSLTR